MGSFIGNPGFAKQFKVGDRVVVVGPNHDAYTLGDVLLGDTFKITEVNKEGKFALELIHSIRKESLCWLGWWEIDHDRNGVAWLMELI